MMKYRIETDGGTAVASQVAVADSFGSRFLGLMGKASLESEEGLLLMRCRSIHCCFMRFPIDAVYLDGAMKIVGIETVKPWRLGRLFRGARHVLELSAGGAAGLFLGDTLLLQDRDEGKHER